MPLRHERPSKEYMRELRAVARAAKALLDHLPKLNLLPDGFPLQQVEGYCESLVRLPDGTAEGSISPLRAADSELNRIRQRFIPAHNDEDEEDEPLIAREGDLDLRLVSLMAAVRSAIERYKVEAGEELETDLTADLPPNPAIDEPRAEAFNALDQADSDINAAAHAFETADEDVQKALEDEKRLVTDAGTQTASTRASLSTEAPRPAVLEWLEVGLTRTANEIDKRVSLSKEKRAAISAEIGDSAAKILEIWFPKLSKTMRVVVQIKRKIWEILAPDTEGNDPASPPADFDYLDIYNRLLRGEPVPDKWAPFVTELDFHFDLKRLHHLGEDDLEKIEGDPGNFVDTALLANCRNLQGLDLDNTQVANIAPLAGLTALHTLYLSGTPVTDITPLAGLTALQTLYLDSTPVTDITPLAGLTALQTLYLDNTQFTDITPLAGLTALQTLYLDNTPVTDITPLAGLTALQTLYLDNTQFTDIAPLAGLTALHTLYLSGTKIADIAPLAGLTALQELYLHNTQVTDITPLAGLTALHKLDLDNTQIADITPLAGLTALQTLWLNGTKIADITPLAGLTALQTLYLHNTQIADITPLAGLTALRHLYLSGTNVTDITPLAHLTDLAIYGVEDNRDHPPKA